MSGWEAVAMIAIVGAFCAPIAFFQAYMIAGLGNYLMSFSVNTTGAACPQASFRRWDWAFLLPMPCVAATMESGRSYEWPDPQAIVVPIALAALFFGFACVARDYVDMRYGPSKARLQGAYVYSGIASIAAGALVATQTVSL